ncbi:hypothetical protein NQZ68_032580 [Dissostichus eleginoides]|nr:hypothetical protein NQZ68_032576 [Dissostichus eleginoides]KAI9532382.1 hypothetical protein NQZ68_032580 [Dissostichus eleginoides]
MPDLSCAPAAPRQQGELETHCRPAHYMQEADVRRIQSADADRDPAMDPHRRSQSCEPRIHSFSTNTRKATLRHREEAGMCFVSSLSAEPCEMVYKNKTNPGCLYSAGTGPTDRDAFCAGHL